MTLPAETVRLHQIGAGIERRLAADEAQREAVRRALSLGAVRSLEATVQVAPSVSGWRLTGHVLADVDQTCGVTLEPLPTRIDERFAVDVVEADPDEVDQDAEIDLTLDSDDADRVTEGEIDLWAYAIEHVSLALDPFPRKPGVAFVQPEEPAEVSPFSVLTRLKPPSGES